MTPAFAEVENTSWQNCGNPAGYEKEMDALLEYNQGLHKSRFPKRFSFDDYNEDELRELIAMYIHRKLNKPVKVEGVTMDRPFASQRGDWRGKEGLL